MSDRSRTSEDPVSIQRMMILMKKRDTPSNLTSLIRTLRRTKGWTQYDLEGRTGISQSRLSLLERGIRPLTTEDVAILFEAFGVEPPLDETPPAD